MKRSRSPKNIWIFLSAVLLVWTALGAVEGTPGSLQHTSTPSTAPAGVAQPCPTCPAAIGLEEFRQSVGGEIVPVIVELRESPGAMSKMAAEAKGRAMTVPQLMAHSATLLEAQRSLIASLQRGAVRHELRD